MTSLALGAVEPLGSSAAVHYFSGASATVQASSAPIGGASDPLNSTFKQLVDALQSVNGEQSALDKVARQMETEGAQVTPSEMVTLSMRCDEFLFHCELTSNAANRSSDGLQELFKEQS